MNNERASTVEFLCASQRFHDAWALVTTQALLVAGTAGDDVALRERTQGAAVTAQVYVAATNQPLTSSPDSLQVHELHHGPHRSWH